MSGLAGLGVAAGGELSPVRAFLASVPRWLWIALAVVLAIGGLAWWHFDAVGDAREEGHRAGVAEERARATAQAIEWKGRIDGLTVRFAAKLRKSNDEKLAANARAADDLRLRGPGRAACPGVAGGASAAGGPVSADRPGDAAMAEVPERIGIDLIALPFAPTVDFGEQHDAFRIEAMSWREWYARLVAEWARYEADLKASQAVAPK